MCSNSIGRLSNCFIPPDPMVGFAQTSYGPVPENATAEVTVLRIGSNLTNVTVDWRTVDSTASYKPHENNMYVPDNGAAKCGDYARSNGTLFFGSAAAFKDHAAPTDRDRAYARSWRRRWVKRVVVLDFLQCRVCDASAIAAINDAVDAYRDLGLTVVLRHLSRDAALLLRAASARADVVFDERDDDPSYYVAATTPDGLGQPKQGQTVVVEPADEGKGAP